MEIIEISDSEYLDWIVLILLVIRIFIVVALPVLGTYFMIKYQHKLSNEAIEQKHGALWDGLTPGEQAPLWNLFLYCA